MAVLESINAAIAWLQQALQELETEQAAQSQPAQPQSPVVVQGSPEQKIAWGAKVSPSFKSRILWIADALGCDASELMACIAWESGETFSPDIKNAAGSGATGLIQFMPSTAIGLGTSITALAAMTAEDQLKYVYLYFKPDAGKLKNLGDVYMAILWPSGIGKPESYILFDRTKTPTTFRQNAGLDGDHNGAVTRAECLVKINQKLAKGMQPGYLG